jgi:hypothetical protein
MTADRTLHKTADRAFHWSDAAVGAGTAALAIFLPAADALVLSRRHSRGPVPNASHSTRARASEGKWWGVRDEGRGNA